MRSVYVIMVAVGLTAGCVDVPENLLIGGSDSGVVATDGGEVSSTPRGPHDPPLHVSPHYQYCQYEGAGINLDLTGYSFCSYRHSDGGDWWEPGDSNDDVEAVLRKCDGDQFPITIARCDGQTDPACYQDLAGVNVNASPKTALRQLTRALAEPPVCDHPIPVQPGDRCIRLPRPRLPEDAQTYCKRYSKENGLANCETPNHWYAQARCGIDRDFPAYTWDCICVPPHGEPFDL